MSSSSDPRVRVLHFIANSESQDYFPLIARHTDWTRFALTVGSLDRAGAMHEALSEMALTTFALGVHARGQFPGAAVRLARRLRRERIDVLHMHLFEASIVGVAAAKLARTRLVVFTGHHSHEIPLHDRRLLLEIDRTLCRLSDVLIAPSRQMARAFIADYGAAPEKVEVIRHGLDLERFQPTSGAGHRFRAELGWQDAVVMLAISKHHWVKNLPALIRSFARLAERHPEVRLVILGVGDPAETLAAASALGVADIVRVLAPRADIPDVLAAADLFVHAAIAESFGFAIVEAMAMARPVVTTAVGIAPEIIEDGVNGILARSGDVESLTTALERALDMRDNWPALGRAARQCALAFSAQKWIDEHQECYVRHLGWVTAGRPQMSRRAGSHGSRDVSLSPRRTPRKT